MTRAEFYKLRAPGAPSSQNPNVGPSARCPGPAGGGACPNTHREPRCVAGDRCPVFSHSLFNPDAPTLPPGTPATPPRRRLAFVASRQVMDRNGRVCDLANFDLRLLFDGLLRESHERREPLGTVTTLKIAD